MKPGQGIHNKYQKRDIHINESITKDSQTIIIMTAINQGSACNCVDWSTGCPVDIKPSIRYIQTQ